MLSDFRKLPFAAAMVLWLIIVIAELAACRGVGLGALAAFDLLILMTLGLIALPFLVTHAVGGRIQGVLTFIGAWLILLTVLGVLAAVIKLIFLILASLYFPLWYFIIYSDFDVPTATLWLSATMTGKFIVVGLLILAHQRLLENLGLVVLVATSLLLSLLVSVMHSAPPGVFVTITDALAALIILILALIRSIGFMLSSLPAAKKALGI
jgi:hypothetical protein